MKEIELMLTPNNYLLNRRMNTLTGFSTWQVDNDQRWNISVFKKCRRLHQKWHNSCMLSTAKNMATVHSVNCQMLIAILFRFWQNLFKTAQCQFGSIVV